MTSQHHKVACRCSLNSLQGPLYPEIRPNFSGSHTFFLTATAKIGPDTKSHKFVLTAARFWPQLWLAVGINGNWKRLCLAWLFSRMISRRRREGSILLPFLLFYGLKIGKYACLNMYNMYLKIQILVHIFSGFALFTVLTWVYCKVESVYPSCWPRTMCRMCLLIYQQTSANQNTASHLKTGFIWKFSREWLLWTGYASGGSLRKKPPSPTVKY